ncbi:MAG: asparagine synthase (glutamine-hydrolyzing) [Anaerolineae bacterium]|nr:asparagine synthase (glutamine-hydrolyzing) [Gemmatimonadaceae bacterium]
MCGIAGRSDVKPIAHGHAQELSDRMQHALRNRGPDSGQMHHDEELLLVHRRLSILDLSEAGSQPLWNEDKTICVIANGEIYNFRDLRHSLLQRGHRFRSHSDSEVLIHLYEDGGINGCCSAADGMFAFALWDARTRDLYLVRDRLGIKPLVIAEHEAGLTFGSTLLAILADDSVARTTNDEALAAVLRWGFVPSPWSGLKQARRVTPGSWLRVRRGRIVEERRWWRDLPAKGSGGDAEVRLAIEDAVRSHLVSDVPIGALLSAGIDSGIVTALAAKHSERDAIEAWTASHRGHGEDEFEGATMMASHLGVTLHEIPVGGRGLTESRFEAMVSGLDEPLADTSLVGLHALFEAIAPQRRVVLSGDGSDELFGGYDWHLGMPAVPSWARAPWFRLISTGLAPLAGMSGRIGVLGQVAEHVGRHPAAVYLDKFRLLRDDELRLLGIDSSTNDPIETMAVEAWDLFAGTGTLEQMLAVDRATMLVDQMLAKIDTASMAYSVESRVPFLDTGVLTAAKRLPGALKRSGSIGKRSLRDWYAELGPPAQANRRKTGFNSPLDSWLSGITGDMIRESGRSAIAALGGSHGAAESPKAVFAAAVIGAWSDRTKQSVTVPA